MIHRFSPPYLYVAQKHFSFPFKIFRREFHVSMRAHQYFREKFLFHSTFHIFESYPNRTQLPKPKSSEFRLNLFSVVHIRFIFLRYFLLDRTTLFGMHYFSLLLYCVMQRVFYTISASI